MMVPEEEIGFRYEAPIAINESGCDALAKDATQSHRDIILGAKPDE